jgi:putative CocE/NonD family hydrolase
MKDSDPFQIDKTLELKALYKGYSTDSIHITMRDGVKIAAEIILPKNLPSNIKIPAILIQTRYWRAYDLRVPFKWIRKEAFNTKVCKLFTRYGYALVVSDVRGTGASFGIRLYPFSDNEINDGKELIDWIIKQSWSNKKVFTWGNSYLGVTAELAAIHNHPNLNGIVARHNPWDLYTHAAFPGGCFNKGYITYWSNLGKGLDQTTGKALLEFKPINLDFALLGYIAAKGVKPIRTDKKKNLLKQVAHQHTLNTYPLDYLEKINFRNDLLEELGINIDDISIFKKKKEIEDSKVPLLCWGSWQDSATADIVINRFMTLKNSQISIIGDWDHIGQKCANPYFSSRKSAKPKKSIQIKSWIQFYELCLENYMTSKKILYYYTMGEERWKETKIWPPSGQNYQKWYFSDHDNLSTEKPQSVDGKDEYKINFTTTTGIRNRWYTLLSLPVKYPNKHKVEKNYLIYNSSPLMNDIEITGHPVVKIFLRSTHEDGAIFIHLEFIDNKGKIHFLTDGQLRFIHRTLCSKEPPYSLFTPYHSFKKEDYSPYKPGEIIELNFGLYPTSILLKKGFKLRIVISGADKDSFARYPKSGNPILTIFRNSIHSSFLEIPIMTK